MMPFTDKTAQKPYKLRNPLAKPIVRNLFWCFLNLNTEYNVFGLITLKYGCVPTVFSKHLLSFLMYCFDFFLKNTAVLA